MRSIFSSIFNITLLSLLVLTACNGSASSQVAPEAQQTVLENGTTVMVLSEAETDRVFRRVMQFAREEQLHERSFGEIKQAVAEQFLGTKYLAGMLDEPKNETLVISLTAFDCVLFNEAVLALSQGAALEDYSYEGYVRRIRDLRYRDGVLDGYPSRLHYFSEWILDNESRGTVENITRELGGKPLNKRLTFMTEHRSSYPHLADDQNFRRIVEAEQNLRDHEIFYIPQDEIHTVYDRLQPGDIIATATDIEGLDVTHTGIVYKTRDGGTGFIHASTTGQVMLSPDLQTYVKGITRQIGLIIARPADPRLAG